MITFVFTRKKWRAFDLSFWITVIGFALHFAVPTAAVAQDSPPAGPPATAVSARGVPGDFNEGKMWWPAKNDRDEILRRVPSLANAIKAEGWDDLDLDKFLAACASPGRSIDLISNQFLGVPPGTVQSCKNIAGRMALPHHLPSSLKQYMGMTSAEVEGFWKRSGLVSEDLLNVLADEFSRKPESKLLDADPFFLAQDGVRIVRIEIDPHFEVPTVQDLRVVLSDDSEFAAEYSLKYRFMDFDGEWRLVDILHGASPSESLRLKLGLRGFLNAIGMELVPLAPSPGDETAIERCLFMARTETTQAQWKAVIGNNPSHFQIDRHPVESISWHEAMDFCDRLTAKEKHLGLIPESAAYRLPTVQEWEIAAKALEFKIEEDLTERAWMIDNSDDQTQPVASLKPNSCGFHDLEGNVQEWTLDSNPDFPDSRELRGGAYANLAEDWIGGIPRNSHPPDSRQPYIGFRPVLDLNFKNERHPAGPNLHPKR